MHYTKSEVMKIVESMIGKDAEGILIDEEAIDSDEEVSCFPIYTNIAQNFILESTDEVEVRCGMSKVVLIPKHKDYVIKMPFTAIFGLRVVDTITGEYRPINRLECNCDFGCSNCSHDSCIAGELDEVEEANSELQIVGKSQYDHCDMELANYLNATSDLKKILAKIEFVGNFNSIPIYVQEKAKFSQNEYGMWSAYSHFISHETEYIEDHHNPGFYDIFIQRVIELFGFKKTIDVFEEIRDSFEDMHSGNYGYTSTGTPIIFDYSDYDGTTYEY